MLILEEAWSNYPLAIYASQLTRPLATKSLAGCYPAPALSEAAASFSNASCILTLDIDVFRIRVPLNVSTLRSGLSAAFLEVRGFIEGFLAFITS